MKKAVFIIGIAITLFISCKKNNTIDYVIGPPLYGNQDSAWIFVDSCKMLGVDSSPFTICFDSLLNDSRCPFGATCVWSGYALARFKITRNNQQYFIKLATDNVLSYKNDTTINNVKLKLDSLLPHPAINNIYPYSAYKAKIIISL